MLSDFCAKNHTSQEKVDEILAFYKNGTSEKAFCQSGNCVMSGVAFSETTEKRKGISG